MNQQLIDKAKEYLERECRQIITMSETQILEIMADFAAEESKRKAQEFAEWTQKVNAVLNPHNGLWIYSQSDSHCAEITTAELWQQFERENT